MKEITLLQPFGGHRTGAVLDVVYPRQPVTEKCVDAVRALSMVDKGLAVEGRVEEEKPKRRARKKKE